MDTISLSTFDDAIRRCFKPIAKALELPLTHPREGVYEIVSSYCTARIRFCMSCHDPTDANAKLYKDQVTLANLLDWKVSAYQQALGFGLSMGFGAIAEDMTSMGQMNSLVQLNRASGLAAEVRVEQQLIDEGNTILGANVGARTSDGGLRVIDRLVQTPSGQITAVEVKSGEAVRNAQQLLRDNLMAIDGATLVGRNAPPVLRDQQLIIPTIERRYP